MIDIYSKIGVWIMQGNNDLNDYTDKATSKLYDSAIKTIRQEIFKGRTFKQATEALDAMDVSLKSIIIDDFLKNLVADQHFNKGRGIDDLALILDVSYERIEQCRDNIMAEIDLYTEYENQQELFSVKTH